MEKSKRNKLHKRIKLLGVCVSLMLFLSACEGEQIKTFVATNLKDMMTARINANQNDLETLTNAGLISEEKRNVIQQNLQKKEQEFIAAAEGTDPDNKTMFRSVSVWRHVEWKHFKDNKNREGYYEGDWYKFIVTSAIDGIGSPIPGYDYLNVVHNKSSVVPIAIIDEKTGTEINKTFGFPIYVLKTAKDLGGEATEQPLDEISEMINRAISNPDSIDIRILDKYFKPAKNEKGEKVTLLDVTKRENQVVVTSDGASLEYVNHPDDIENGANKVLKSQHEDIYKWKGGNYANEPGKDMIVSQLSYPVFAMRFTEFNHAGIQNIVKTLGLTDQKYLVVPDKSGGRIYLLEYPVHRISKFKEKESNSFEVEFEQSNLGVNLKTGDLVKYSGAWNAGENGTSLSGVMTVKENPYLNLLGAKNNTDVAHASFSLFGDFKMKLGYKNDMVDVGRLVLKDYLEATYAPEVVSGENVVLFGRKLRVERFTGTKDQKIASFYNQQGEKIEDGGDLYIQDFADIEALTSESPSVKYIRGLQEKAREESTGGTGSAGTDKSQTAADKDKNNNSADNKDSNSQSTDKDIGSGGDGADGGGSSDDYIKRSIQKISNLPTSTVTEIKASVGFPSAKIGSVDNYQNDVPYFYTMAVRKSMFETGLFSGWIYNNDETGNSLPWWNAWLLEHKYNYKIDKTILEEYLSGNYAYELGKFGIVVLDLGTVAKISAQYQREAVIDRNEWIQTGFMLLGYALTLYATLLMLFWIIDVRVGLGLNLLEKATLGNYIGIADKYEMPQMDTEGRKYVDFKTLFVNCFYIVLLGVVLIFIDFFQIAWWLIKIVGGVSTYITRIINGL